MPQALRLKKCIDSNPLFHLLSITLLIFKVFFSLSHCQLTYKTSKGIARITCFLLKITWPAAHFYDQVISNSIALSWSVLFTYRDSAELNCQNTLHYSTVLEAPNMPNTDPLVIGYMKVPAGRERGSWKS